MPSTQAKQKIAVLGGGAGALAAAFELTSVPGWQDRYEVTVYQLGWRLGGKGASGRNAELGQRIEEHGLHLWFGWYENAFRVMRLAYEELHRRNLAPRSPFQDWKQAFTGFGECAWMDKSALGWQSAAVTFPDMGGEPGSQDLFDSQQPLPSLWEFVFLTVRQMLHWYQDAPERPAALKLARRDIPSWLRSAALWLGSILERLALTPIHIAARLARALERAHAGRRRRRRWLLVRLLGAVLGWLIRWAEAGLEESPRARQVLRAIDVAAAAVRGALADDLLTRGLEAVAHRDMIEWLESHGSRYARLVLLPLYDGGFAYEDGNSGKLRMAADAGLYFALRQFLTCRGAFSYHMNAGMGDVVFSPLYLVLRARGVRFEFFHQVSHLGLSGDGRQIDAIDMNVQAEVHGGDYDPLSEVRGLPCWPNAPDYSQLERGDELREAMRRGYNLESGGTGEAYGWSTRRRTLERGTDFHLAVLGISIGALPAICGELTNRVPRWADMLNHLKTVKTQALQLWLNRDAASLGNRYPVLGCYLEPFDTIASMGHLIPREDWRPEDNVREIVYLCNAMPEAGVDGDVLPNSLQFLGHAAAPVWPDGCGSGDPRCFDWNLLVDRSGSSGEARLRSQYMRANVAGSELYVLSLPGSGKYRLKPGDSGCENLFLAGDWTENGINLGCVEAAVISGQMASRSICGSPTFIYGAFSAEDALPTPPEGASAAAAAAAPGF
ncbi:MAG TPA: NAD(P)-binding protein [Bryobacteraceae bacterium]|nr:NAD(P)-binding protein [Bryobacteraceae bacterium]